MVRAGKTIVIKLGTSSICDETTHAPLLSNLSLLVEAATKLRKNGYRVVIVSSGGIAMGLRQLSIEKRPKILSTLQAIAAVGQCSLMALWTQLFGLLNQQVGQILLTRNDVADRSQYLNAKNTLNTMLDLGIIPIVNENDTLAVSEIRFGDNDTLSAITAAMVSADYLFLLTDVECLYENNPRTHKDAKQIEVVTDFSKLTADVSSAGSAVGTGGMYTKIIAAKLATSAGITTIITLGSVPSNIEVIVEGLSMASRPQTPIPDEQIARLPLPKHTRFLPSGTPMRDRHIWILHSLHPEGKIIIDQGAYKALTRKEKAGLLPAGILHVEGHFGSHQAVSLCIKDASDADVEVGRALTNYTSVEIDRIKGRQSNKVQEILGYADTEYVAHRDNLAFYAQT